MSKKSSNNMKTVFRNQEPANCNMSAKRITTLSESFDESLINELLEKMATLEEFSGFKNFIDCCLKAKC